MYLNQEERILTAQIIEEWLNLRVKEKKIDVKSMSNVFTLYKKITKTEETLDQVLRRSQYDPR